LVLDASQADLVIGAKKGTGKIANPTINGGPVDSRPVIVETTNDAIRVGVQKGHPRDVSQLGPRGSTTDKPHPGVEGGAEKDVFKVFQGKVKDPAESAVVWQYLGKDGLKSPQGKAGGQFRKAVEESEQAEAQKQQEQERKKNP
jgi:hypothetical protein